MRNRYVENIIKNQYCYDIFLFIEYQKAELATLSEQLSPLKNKKNRALLINARIEMAKKITHEALKKFLD